MFSKGKDRYRKVLSYKISDSFCMHTYRQYTTTEVRNACFNA